jgi:hypothetical protein
LPRQKRPGVENGAIEGMGAGGSWGWRRGANLATQHDRRATAGHPQQGESLGAI